MGTVLRYAIPGLLGLGVTLGIIGGCSVGKVIEDKAKPLNNADKFFGRQ